MCANTIAASRIENLSGDGFDLLSAGQTAQNVPTQAVTVDNTDPAIYRDRSQWSDFSDTAGDYGGTLSYTAGSGSLNYSFDGVAIWYDCVSHTIQ